MFQNEVIETVQKTTFKQTSTMIFTPESTGIVKCGAKNSEGTNETSANVIVNDLNEDLIIWSDNELPISSGDDVRVTCGASAHKYATELNWFKNGVLVNNSTGLYFNKNASKRIFF